MQRKPQSTKMIRPGDKRVGFWSGIQKVLSNLFSNKTPATKLKNTAVETVSRRWRLLQLESTLACNLRCVMCPWVDFRKNAVDNGIMSPVIWNAVKPYLPEIESVDFTGGGEPLLQPRLVEWLAEAKSAGCVAGFLTNGVLLNENTADKLLANEIDWICFSIDSPLKAEYEHIRPGSHFEKVCGNLEYLAKSRAEKAPLLMINYVIMENNVEQMSEMVELAARLGVDKINFKQCEVSREKHGRGFGIFGSNRDRQVARYEKIVQKAFKQAKNYGIDTMPLNFFPNEQCVCDQDPRSSLFVRYDGIVSPCINLANAGKSIFLGKDVDLPFVHYGKLPDMDLLSIWNSEQCTFYKTRFEERCREYEKAFLDGLLGGSPASTERIKRNAWKRMPKAPAGCGVCHFLYGL